MRPVPYREIKRKLEAAGFVQVGQTGSHVKFAKTTSEGTLTTTVPKHREVAAGTLRSILRQAHLDQHEFEQL
jgi:predicted RNA binding protein YcfA (HicA-like mRNA interferase family)